LLAIIIVAHFTKGAKSAFTSLPVACNQRRNGKLLCFALRPISKEKWKSASSSVVSNVVEEEEEGYRLIKVTL